MLTAAGDVTVMEEEEARCFLSRFVEEFPAALEDDHPLPVNPLSRKVSLEELHGESLDLGLRLLSARYVWEGDAHRVSFIFSSVMVRKDHSYQNKKGRA